MEKKRFLFDTNNFDDAAAKAVSPVEEYVPPAPTYSESELRAAIESAREEFFKKGKHEGFLESEEGFSKNLLQICESLSHNVEVLLDKEATRNELFENDSISIIKTCLDTALPDLMTRGDFDSTLQFISQEINNYSHESDIIIEVDESYVEPLQNYFKQNLEEKSERIKFKAVAAGKDNALPETKISWANGGATRKPEDLKENILKVMKQALAENASAKHNAKDKDKKKNKKPLKEDLKISETNDE